MKNAFHIRDRAANVQDHTVGMLHNSKTVGAEEVRDRLVIRCRGSELFDELLRSEVVAIIKAGGVVKLTQQIVEGAFIAQGQADGKIQARFRGKPATRG